jgi:hypothetical protein
MEDTATSLVKAGAAASFEIAEDDGLQLRVYRAVDGVMAEAWMTTGFEVYFLHLGEAYRTVQTAYDDDYSGRSSTISWRPLRPSSKVITTRRSASGTGAWCRGRSTSTCPMGHRPLGRHRSAGARSSANFSDTRSQPSVRPALKTEPCPLRARHGGQPRAVTVNGESHDQAVTSKSSR